MRFFSVLVLGALLAAPACASARLADLSVYDRTDQRYLTIHEHRGQRYVAGQPGQHPQQAVQLEQRGQREPAARQVVGTDLEPQHGLILRPAA